MGTSRAELAAQLDALGVEQGSVVLIHMSYRAVRPVDDGPIGVIDALRMAVGPEGTIVMPSWSGDDDIPFDPGNSAACSSLGATADLFWRLPDVRRSAHAFAFAAQGPQAERITSDPSPTPPHCLESPVGRVFERDGQVLLLGVGHDANTTIHLAEVMARVPYGVPKYYTVLENGSFVRVNYLENDCCCERFALADEWLRRGGLQREGRVGQATARLVRSQDLVSVTAAKLAEDPLIFLHRPEDRCEECDQARQSVSKGKRDKGKGTREVGRRKGV